MINNKNIFKPIKHYKLMLYRKIKLLGSGSYGYVYLAQNIKTLKKYAIKKILLNNTTYDSCINEIKIMTKIKSPYIIEVYDYFKIKNYLYIVMEYAPYGDLYSYIQGRKNKNKSISYRSIKYVMCSISKGLRDLHRNNIIHRDIKPCNILICKGNKIKIADFGISRIVEGRHQMIYTKIGTPYYMSPEVLNGYRYSYSIDHWGLGCIFYELLTLKRPFESNNLLNLYYKIKMGKYNIKILPTEYIYIIKGLLNKSPLLRFNEREILDFYNDQSSYNIKVGFNVYSRTNIKLSKININDSLEKKVRSKYVLDNFNGRRYNKKVSKLPNINKY